MLTAKRSLSRPTTYAYIVQQAGVPMVAIQQNLGCTSLDTTLHSIGDLPIDQRKPLAVLRPNVRWLRG